MKILFCLFLSFFLIFAGIAYSQSQDEYMMVEYYAIPSPDEILTYVHNNEIEYTPTLLADLSRKDEFNTFKERQVIFGVYMANMAYSISFEQTNTALHYFEVIEAMGKSMNLFPPEVEELGERLMNNFSQMDSLNALYDELYLLVIANLHETDRFGEYALISAGGFVESMHLALNSKGSRVKENEFRLRVWDQKMIAGQLQKMFDLYLNPTLRDDVKSSFDPLVEVFYEFSEQADTISASLNHDGALVIGKSNPPDTENTRPIDKVHHKINELRREWVKE